MKNLIFISIGSIFFARAVSAFELNYGSEECMDEQPPCIAHMSERPVEFFLLDGQTVDQLNELNELIDLSEGSTVPAMTYIRRRDTSTNQSPAN